MLKPVSSSFAGDSQQDLMEIVYLHHHCCCLCKFRICAQHITQLHIWTAVPVPIYSKTL